MYDIERERVGRVAYVDLGGNLAWIQPENGGSEWTALPEQLRPVPETPDLAEGVA